MHCKNASFSTVDSRSVCQILDTWQGDGASIGVLALMAESERDALPVLQQACRERKIPLCGAMFPALVTDSGFVTRGAWLLCLDQMPPGFLLPNLEPDAEAAAARIESAVMQLLPGEYARADRPTLYMVFDGMLPSIATILDRLYLRLADKVGYAGVNAGNERFQPMPCLFDAENVASDGVLGLLLPADTPFFLEHGYPAPRHFMLATSSEGNRIITIDWRPAFDVYKEIIAGEYGVALTRENFYHFSVHYPFGILRANGDVAVRFPVALCDDGSLQCIGEVPENGMLVLMQASSASSDRCIDRLVGNLRAGGRTLEERPLLTFVCAGRRMHLGDPAAAEELAELKRRSGASTLFGALSLGEIGAGESGYPMFHNAALVCAPWKSS